MEDAPEDWGPPGEATAPEATGEEYSLPPPLPTLLDSLGARALSLSLALPGLAHAPEATVEE